MERLKKLANCGMRSFYNWREEVDMAIIACTDLNVVASEDFVDSAKCLAEAVVRMYLSNIKKSS